MNTTILNEIETSLKKLELKIKETDVDIKRLEEEINNEQWRAEKYRIQRELEYLNDDIR